MTADISSAYQLLSTDFFLPVRPAGPIAGMRSRSEMIISGWRAGLRERTEITRDFSLDARAAFGPKAKFTSRTSWNLLPALADPGDITEARGTILEISAAADWRVYGNVKVRGGYSFWSYQANSGTRTRRYTDGSTYDLEFDRVRSSRKGLFLGLAWGF